MESINTSPDGANPIWFVIKRVYKSLCNQRNVFGLVFNFMKNFSLVFLWLCVFKNAGLIPIEWRPSINVTILRDCDEFIFNGFSGLVCGLIIFLISYQFAKYFYSSRPLYPYGNKSCCSSHREKPDDDDLEGNNSSNNNGNKLMALFLLCPTISMLATIWLDLNLAYLCINYIASVLDIMAWLSYVIGHITAPIVTAVYLWLFTPPGVCGLFGLALGLQNLAGVFTHLLFPTAPPWYNHLYGEQPGNYSIPGYAAGLTRVDFALGTHLHNDGFHMSPIVFGAFPSLHSAFVCLIFLFISRYASWGGSIWGWGLIEPSRKVKNRKFSSIWKKLFTLIPLGTGICSIYMIWQWWATMYLDHHYRLDLLGGAIYALVAFCIVFPKIKKHEREFQDEDEDDDKTTTGGMRLFQGSSFAYFFNSLANPSLDYEYMIASPSSSELDDYV